MSRLRALAGDRFSADVVWNIAALMIAGVFGIALNYAIGDWYGAAVLGVFNQVFATYIVLSQVAVLGVHSSVLAHLAAETNPYAQREIVTAALCVAGAQATIAAVAMVALAEPIGAFVRSPDVALGIRFAAPGLVAFALNKVMFSAINAQRRMRWYAILQASRILFLVAAFVGWSMVDASTHTLPVILTIAEVATLLLTVPSMRASLGRGRAGQLRHWTTVHLRFGMRGFLSGLFSDLGTRVDVLVLGAFANDAVVGAYSFAALVAEGMYQVLVALRTNYAPLVVALLVTDTNDELSRLIRRGRNRTYVGFAAIGVVSVAGYGVIVRLLAEDPHLAASWVYFAALAIGMVLGSGYVPFNQILLWAKRPGWHTILILIVLITLVAANVPLAALWGALGVAIATGVNHVFAVVVLKVLVRRVLGQRM